MSECRSCGSHDTTVIYQSPDVPVSSCVLITSQEDAVNFPTGQLRLSVCKTCGFIQNDLFDPALVDYTKGYEESQAGSPTFRAFVDETIQDLVGRYELQGKEVFEVGCGKGEWLARICELADMHGLGIDPAYVPGRLSAEQTARFEVRREFFDEDHTNLSGDLIACRHTLEHIGPVRRFAPLLHMSAQRRDGSVTFVEVPDTMRVLLEGAFWDVYYEHAAYFTAGSLARLFRSVGYRQVGVRRAYADQYLLLEARIEGPVDRPVAEEPVSEVVEAAHRFGANARSRIDEWDDLLNRVVDGGKRAVVWGASSKAVGFLSALTRGDVIEYAVDINPMKHGQFLPGAGQEIVAPEFLTTYRPDVVIIMNPIYLDEIGAMLRSMGLSPEVVHP